MDTPLLSIIIPVYQAKPYLSACLDSILQQDFSDYELLLIDDGSNDGSEQLCDFYAQIYPQIYVLHQKNQGVSAARNAGLNLARGTYICFVDADDSIDAHLLSGCMQELQESGADFLHHGMIKNIWKSEKIVSSSPKYKTPFHGFLASQEWKTVFLEDYDQVSVQVYNYIFKKSLLASLRFDPQLPYAEDNVFVIQAFLHADSCFFSYNTGYFYNARMGSAAYRWQPSIVTCYRAVFTALHDLWQKLQFSRKEEDQVMTSKVVNSYSSILYNLCLPSCPLKLRQKLRILHHARKEFLLDRYLPHYSFSQVSRFDQAKLFLILLHLEILLVSLGTLYERKQH